MSDVRRIRDTPRWAKIAAMVGVLLIVLMLLVDKIIMPALVHSSSVVIVPTVVGRPSGEAIRDLQAKGFTISQIDTHADERVVPGSVLYQSPYGGAEVKEGRKIFLIVSSGKELLALPNVVGLNIREAKIKLQMVGLSVGEISYEYNAGVPEETVLRQSRAPGSRIAMDAALALVVSSGPQESNVVMPALVGRTLAEAQTYVQEARLVFGQLTYKTNHNVLPSTVLEQHPAAGDTVKEGSPVQLTVAGE